MHDDEFDHIHGGDDEPEGEVAKDDYYYTENIELTTVGIDIGSSTSHLMFSKLHLQRLGQYHSSRYVVVSRETIHRSPILLTPYTADYNINAEQLGEFIHQSYLEAELKPDDIDSGAIILTGEAVKRTNARAIADLFASEAGKFVCASAGHNLEAIMAAHGSGAAALSKGAGAARTVLNVDVGGGTSKLAVIQNGEILETAATNVGGRLVALDESGCIVRIEPAAMLVAEHLGMHLTLGAKLEPAAQQRIADALADSLLAAVRREKLSPLAELLMLTPALSTTEAVDAVTFSGGVSEFIYEREERDFGDLARPLAEAIRSRITAHVLPAPVEASGERIRATVIGASQFTVQVSGNTISITREDILPIHNLQVIYPRLPDREHIEPGEMLEAIQRAFQRFDLVEGEQAIALAIDWNGMPRYPLLRSLAEGIVQGLKNTLAAGLPLVLVFNNDFGALVGEIVRDEFGVKNDIISIDTIGLQEFDYIDIGEVLYPAHVVPVVVKSLVFPEVHGQKAELVVR
ncbi:MAG TPA: ethanolamine ammonia-lyase reactivating factor EutA [Dehalococcoidia bacterium]|nr:ethanolamine ammonia-lyase reactivating factor EutA [Dehalococcoidia bacterium]